MINNKNKEQCCGCTACVNVCPRNAISMIRDEEGFLYPYVNELLCINCNLCERVCPFVNTEKIDYNLPKSIYACKSKNYDIRINSSSGGVFYSIAKYILSNDGIVFGVTMGEGCKSAKHIMIQSVDELYKLQGSKYIQSDMGDVFVTIKSLLEKGRYILFTGTPCQVNGLKEFLGNETDKLVCVEIVCHGVPSEKLWKKYVEYLEEKNGSSFKYVYFRRKKYGWENYGTLIEYSNMKKRFQFSFENPYYRMFISDICLRPSCYNCKAKGEARRADISLGDFWHIRDVIKNFDDDKGVSLLMLHTLTGKELFEKVKDEFDIAEEKITYSTVVKCNPAIEHSVKKPLMREQFYKDLDELKFDKMQKKYAPKSLKANLRALLIRTNTWRFVKKIRG